MSESSADQWIVLTAYAVVGIVSFIMLRTAGRGQRVVTPIALFIAIEVIAVWPALVPVDGGPLEGLGAFPGLFAAAGLLAAVTAYVMFGGARSEATAWRISRRPSPEQLRSLRIGLVTLVGLLVVMDLYRFNGLPPMLTGGLSSLLDPLGHADDVARIRETRLLLTKGHLVGEGYRGQGILNTVAETGWLVTVASAVLQRVWDPRRHGTWLLVLVGVLTFVFVGSTGKRAPLALCFLAGAAALAIARRPSTRQVVAVAVAGLSALLFIMPLAKGVNAGVTATERTVALVDRISEGNGQNNAQIVRLIESGSLDIQRGGLFQERVLAMIPGASPSDPFALRVTRLAYGANQNTTGYATPTQYGLLYADAGPWGVIGGYALSGLVLAFAWRRICRVRSWLGAVIAIVGAIVLGYISVTGIHGVLSTGLIAALTVFVVGGPVVWGLVPRRVGRHPVETRSLQPGSR